MSRGFIKEGDQEEIPRVPMRAYLPEGVPNYVTKEGLLALKEELRSLEEEQAKAGDDYIMSNFIEAKMKLLIGRINSAVQVDLSKVNKDTVGFGAWVRYNGRVVRIVGVDEADVDQGLISFISPLAKALTGKKSGDVFELNGPGGTERITVEEVSFEPMALTKMVSDKRVETASATERREQKAFGESIERMMQTRLAVEDGTGSPLETGFSAEAKGSQLFEPEVNAMEFLPIVNERGNIVGRALYLELHRGNKMLHPVVHLHVLDGEGVTTRLYWWHVAFGETPEKTLKRKMAEILGVSGVKPQLKRQYIREAKTEKELVYVFTIVNEEDLPETPKGKDYMEVFAKD